MAFSLLSLILEGALVPGILCATLTSVHLIVLVSSHFRHTSSVTGSGRRIASAGDAAGLPAHDALKPDRSIAVFFYVRVALFMAWTLVMIAATLFQAFDTSTGSPFSDMLFACVAPMAFLVFATQPDVLRAWHIPTTRDEWSGLLRKDTKPAVMASTGSGEDLGLAEFLGSTPPELARKFTPRGSRDPAAEGGVGLIPVDEDEEIKLDPVGRVNHAVTVTHLSEHGSIGRESTSTSDESFSAALRRGPDR